MIHKSSIFLVFLLLSIELFGQADYEKEIKSFQEELNRHYADSAESPLLKEDLIQFKGLDFFPVDEDYRVSAQLYRFAGINIIKMKTTTDRLPEYIAVGILAFEIKGTKIELTAYQSLQSLENEDKDDVDILSLPFTDLTNGETSYGGGRYVDLNISNEVEIIIDFNKAYNPYCAYNHKYSCVIPPPENFINIEIKAGVKKFKKKK